jgi:hypothetical protein
MSAVLGFDAWRRLSSGNKELAESRRISDAPFGNQGVFETRTSDKGHAGTCRRVRLRSDRLNVKA